MQKYLRQRINPTSPLWGQCLDFESCCPAQMCHFNRKDAHCPDNDVRSIPGGQQQPYLETGRDGTDWWSC